MTIMVSSDGMPSARAFSVPVPAPTAETVLVACWSSRRRQSREQPSRASVVWRRPPRHGSHQNNPLELILDGLDSRWPSGDLEATCGGGACHGRGTRRSSRRKNPGVNINRALCVHAHHYDSSTCLTATLETGNGNIKVMSLSAVLVHRI